MNRDRRKSVTAAETYLGAVGVVHLEGGEKVTVVRLADDFCVSATGALFAELRVLLGADCIV